MSCEEFLALYSEYLDERIDALVAERCRAHLESCVPCGRYDRVMRGGLAVVRSLAPIEPMHDFPQRLGRRLLAERSRPDGRALTAAAAVSFVVTAAVAFAVWSPARRPADSDVAGPVAATPAGEVGGSGATTLMAGAGPWWGGAGVPHALLGQGGPRLSDLSVTLPGPYSPLNIEPPLVDRPLFLQLASQDE